MNAELSILEMFSRDLKQPSCRAELVQLSSAGCQGGGGGGGAGCDGTMAVNGSNISNPLNMTFIDLCFSDQSQLSSSELLTIE